MKLVLILPLALVAFIGIARAEEADDVREANKTETSTFNARIYAGTPGETAYAASSAATTPSIWRGIPSRRSLP